MKVALITGGARGIGRAAAMALAERGWSVAVSYRTSEKDARSLEAAIRGHGGVAAGFQADVSDPRVADDLVHRVLSDFGNIDALVNCAGPYRRVHLMEETAEAWRAMFDNNLHPVFYLSQAVASGMKERGWGRIVNFGLANADQCIGQPYITAHYIAKVGVLVLTRSLAKVLGPHGITVNAVSPGIIDTGSVPLDDMANMIKNIPAGYVGTPEDVASVVGYLLSDEARYVNGANIHVSGGWGL
jgi:3-oxoacyl-[acyl-carrier protein] reductase